jgi:hypothetical protein
MVCGVISIYICTMIIVLICVFFLFTVPMFIDSELSLYVGYLWCRQKPQQLLRLQKVQCFRAITLRRNNRQNLSRKSLPHYLPIFLIIRETKGTVMVRMLNLLSYYLPSLCCFLVYRLIRVIMTNKMPPNICKLTSSFLFQCATIAMFFCQSAICLNQFVLCFFWIPWCCKIVYFLHLADWMFIQLYIYILMSFLKCT